MSLELRSLEVARLLMQKVETITGKTYSTLTDSIQDLIDGYGGSSEGDSGDSVDFIGIKYSEFDENGYPTVVDARSLRKMNINPAHIATGLLYNSAANNGRNIKVKEVYLPDNITSLAYTFHHCASLEKINCSFENVTGIGASSFGNCISLKEFPYFPNLTGGIASSAFVNCTGLTEVKFYKKLTSCATSAFNGCTNLTDIYVPWAEGEVANAPWGATNATIHYNTTYDENHNPIVEE